MYLEFLQQILEPFGPDFHDGLPHLIATGNITVDKLITKEQTQPPEFWAFDDANGL
jgi:hypothetical protein